jgi:hypothetical protein
MRKTFQETIEHAQQFKYLNLDVSHYHLNGTEPEWEEVGKMHYLKELNISNNQLTNLNCITNLTHLEYLIVVANKLEDASALRNLTNLKELGLRNNYLKEYDFLKSLPQLQYLDISENRLNGTITKETYVQAIEKIKSFVPQESRYEATIKYLDELQNSEIAKNINPILSNPTFGKIVIKHFEDLKSELMQLMQNNTNIDFKLHRKLSQCSIESSFKQLQSCFHSVGVATPTLWKHIYYAI